MKKSGLFISALISLNAGNIKGQYKVLHSFNDTNGAKPKGSLTISGNELYGMTANGGLHSFGCIFSIDTSGSVYNDLLDFDKTNGASPQGSLTLSGSILYGMTLVGGAKGDGLIFSIDTNGIVYNKLLDFNGTNGANPDGSLTLSGNVLYGMTEAGGTSWGNVFSINTNGSGYKDLLNFNYGYSVFPRGSLTLSGNVLYGMTIGDFYQNGFYWGTVFSVQSNGKGYKKLLDLDSGIGAYPFGDLTLSGNKLFGMTAYDGNSRYGWPEGYGCIFSIDTDGSSPQVLHNFNGTNGANPSGSLTLSGNVLFGMTANGGAHGDGLIFSIDTDGSGYKDLFDFDTTNGINPSGSLTLSGNVLYGMTSAGGANGLGVIFSFKDAGLGINELTSTTCIINVYPNPSTGVFLISLSPPELVSTSHHIEIYNVFGQKVFENLKQVKSTNIIDLSAQPNGVYIIHLITTTGEMTRKIILLK